VAELSPFLADFKVYHVLEDGKVLTGVDEIGKLTPKTLKAETHYITMHGRMHGADDHCASRVHIP